MRSLEQGIGTSMHANKVKTHCIQAGGGQVGEAGGSQGQAGSRSEDTKKHGGEDIRSGNPCFNSYLPLH